VQQGTLNATIADMSKAAAFLADPPAADDRPNFDTIIKHGHQDLVQAVAFNGHGDRCATGSVDGKIRVFNRHKDGIWRLCDTWGAHASEILEVFFLPVDLLVCLPSTKRCHLPAPMAPDHHLPKPPRLARHRGPLQALG